MDLTIYKDSFLNCHGVEKLDGVAGPVNDRLYQLVYCPKSVNRKSAQETLKMRLFKINEGKIWVKLISKVDILS